MDIENMDKIILGQEAICPNGLGRVVRYSANRPFTFIRIRLYTSQNEHDYAPINVELIDPRK